MDRDVDVGGRVRRGNRARQLLLVGKHLKAFVLKLWVGRVQILNEQEQNEFLLKTQVCFPFSYFNGSKIHTDYNRHLAI